MNKKILRKVTSIICAIALVVTSVTAFDVTKISADAESTLILKGDAARVDLVAEAKNAEYNFALLKDASGNVTGGNSGGTDITVVTKGNFATARSAATTVTIGQKNGVDKWVQIDLGAAYDSSKIDRVAVQYWSLNTSARGGYTILYSLNGVDFVEVGNVPAYTEAAGNPIIRLDKITMTADQLEKMPFTKYVKVVAASENNNNNNGLQVMDVAVLTDGTTKVSEVETMELEMLDDPASLTVTSSDYGQLEYVFEGATGHDDYTYKAYVDGVSKGDVTPGTEYVLTDLAAGDHTVKIVSFKDGASSNGLVKTVKVADVMSLIADKRNIAKGKTVATSSIRENDNPQFLTDGDTTNLFRFLATEKESNAVIDLGNYYRPDILEMAILVQIYNRYAKDYTIEYSLDGNTFTTVAASVGGTQGLQYTDIDSSAYKLSAMRYVRFSFKNAVEAQYGFQMNELALIVKEDADLTPVEVETLENPASLTVTSSDLSQLEYVFEGAAGHDDYTYVAFVNGANKGIVVPGQKYVVKDLAAGKYTVKIISVKGDMGSEGITQTIDVTDVKSLMTGDRNIAIGKTVTPSSIRQDAEAAPDVPAHLTDGDLTSVFRFVATDKVADAVIDLGNYYQPDILERAAILFTAGRYAKDFTIDYSLDGTTFTTVATSTGAAKELQDVIVDETKYDAPAVRYVRFSLSNPFVEQGFQLYEMALILDEDADLTPVEITVPDDAEAIAAYVKGYNKVEVTITAAEGQEEAGYTYSVLMDGKKLVLSNVAAGTHTLDKIPSGTHTFTVKSVYNNVQSAGIESAEVEVQDSYIYTVEYYGDSKDIAGKVLPDTIENGKVTYNNYARFKGVKADASTVENAVNVPANVLDGGVEYPADETHPEAYIADKTRWASEAGIDDTWFQVDLGTTYTINVIDIVWQTASAKDYTISVSADGIKYTEVADLYARAGAARYDGIELREAVDARFVRINGVSRSGAYGYSIWGLGIYGAEEQKAYTVTVDDEVYTVPIDDNEFVLPETATYGYFDGKDMYKAGTTVVVDGPMAFTSVNDLSVTVEQGAGIRLDGTAGIRFQAKVNASEEFLNSGAITEGMLITANDLYEANDSTLDLTSAYTFKNIVNRGWYNDAVGTYCGSIVNIVESNYIRNFIAKAYATVKYTDGTTLTIYSGMTGVRSISGVANAIIDAGALNKFTPDEQAMIQMFAAAK